MKALVNPFRLIFSFKGSINRIEYLCGLILALVIVFIFTKHPDPKIEARSSFEEIFLFFKYVTGMILFLVVNAAISVKRLRDLRWTMWLLPLFIMPLMVFQFLGTVVPGEMFKYHCEKTPSPKGLGGWLSLVGISLVALAVVSIVNLIQIYPVIAKDFLENTWNAVNIYQLIAEIIFLLLNLYFIVLFLRKKKSFPRWFIGFSLIILITASVAFFWQFLADGYTSINGDVRQIFIESLRGCLIWVPYMYFSRRVKATFVN
jgi:uncharacterized membrane protein YhaH (DUF805 family)